MTGERMDARADRWIGTVVGDRYEVISLIARGGAGAVYRAAQRPIGRPVALKLLRGDLGDAEFSLFVTRFLREAELAGRLRHPHIVTYLDAGSAADGTPYVVMELLEGRTLKEAVRGGPMAPDEAVRIAAALASGLAHAHGRGVVHRDIKPGNIFLIDADDGREQPVLVDFGLVKNHEDLSQTQTSVSLGTPPYMAPEQVTEGSSDPPVDVYALGVLLYRMVAGVLPFIGTTAMQVAMAHVHEPVPPIAERAPGVPVDPPLEALIRACMAKDPAARPTAAEVFAQLTAWGSAADDGMDVVAMETTGTAAMRRPAPVASPPAPAPAPASRRRGLMTGLIGGALAGAVGVGAWVVTGSAPEEAAPPPVVAPAVVTPPPAAPATPPPVAPAEPPPTLDLAADDDAAPTSPPPPVPAREPPVREPAPAPAAPARSAPPTAPPAAGPVVVDGVSLSAKHAARLVAFVNDATREELVRAGVYVDGVARLVDGRPFADVAAIGDVKGIGQGTMRSLAARTADDPSKFREPAAADVFEDGKITVDEVVFDRDHAKRALAWVNEASRDALVAAGVYEAGVTVIRDRRPFPSLSALGATPLIGTSTLQAIHTATAQGSPTP